MNVWKVIIACHFNVVRIFLEATIALLLTFFIAGIAIFVQVFRKSYKGTPQFDTPISSTHRGQSFSAQKSISVVC